MTLGQEFALRRLQALVSEQKNVDLSNNGECSQCGECCSRLLPMHKQDIQAIKAWLARHNKYKTRQKQKNFVCPFRNDKEGKCDIYEIRPTICRKFCCWKSSINDAFDLLGTKLADQANMSIVDLGAEFFGWKNKLR